jgi:hypothetical protein
MQHRRGHILISSRVGQNFARLVVNLDSHSKACSSVVTDAVSPVFDHFASVELLRKCRNGRTQTLNETLNVVAWILERCYTVKYVIQNVFVKAKISI